MEPIAQCETGTIVGTAGVKEPAKRYVYNFAEDINYAPTLQRCCENRLYDVSCVDKRLFDMTLTTWKALPFDEELRMCLKNVVPVWHIYFWSLEKVNATL